MAGFGANSRVHTATLFRLSEDLPLVIDWVDTPERVERLLPHLHDMVITGLITHSGGLVDFSTESTRGASSVCTASAAGLAGGLASAAGFGGSCAIAGPDSAIKTAAKIRSLITPSQPIVCIQR